MDVNLANHDDGNALRWTYAMGPDELQFPSLVMRTNSIEHLSLGDVMKNKHVKDLFDNFMKTTEKVASLADDLCKTNNECRDLRNECRDLRNDYDEMKSRYLELLHDQPRNTLLPCTQGSAPSALSLLLYPSDSVSQDAATASSTESSISPLSSLIDQPVDQPAKYPQEILWNYEDVKHCPHVKLSSHNKSRPPVQQCLRTPTGTIVSVTQWVDIRHSSTNIVQEVLHPLIEYASPETVFRKRYFKKNWLREWQGAVAKLEARQSILRLCSLHWKAELILAHALDLNPFGKSARKTKSGSMAMPLQPGTAAPEPVPQAETLPPPSQPPSQAMTPPLPPSPPRATSSSPPAPPPPPPSPPRTTMPSPTSSEKTTATPPSQTAAVPSPLKFSKHGIDPNSPVAQVKKRTKRSVPEILAIVVSTAADADTSKVDVSGIDVTATYEALKDIVMKDANLQHVPHVINLLEALRRIPETAEGPSSPAVEDFLAGIEQADPNALDTDEDNTNASWGHYHFRSGIWFDNITWEQTVNKKMAYRILVAMIKTCHVACHLCFKRSINTNGVVADMYFETIVWNLWQTVIESSASSLDIPTQNGLQGSELSELQEHSKLQTLRVTQLKALAQRLNVKVPKSKKGKTLTKNDYIVALASVMDIIDHLDA